MEFSPIPKYPRKKKFQCEKCNKNFSSKFSMKRHAEDCGVCRSRVICENCNKSLKNRENLQKHRVICLGNPKKVACSQCDELFCSQFSLKRHIWRFHLDEELPNCSSSKKLPTDKTIKKEIENKGKETGKNKKILNFSQTEHPIETPDEYKYRYVILDGNIHCDYDFSE